MNSTVVWCLIVYFIFGLVYSGSQTFYLLPEYYHRDKPTTVAMVGVIATFLGALLWPVFVPSDYKEWQERRKIK